MWQPVMPTQQKLLQSLTGMQWFEDMADTWNWQSQTRWAIQRIRLYLNAADRPVQIPRTKVPPLIRLFLRAFTARETLKLRLNN